MAIIIFNDGDRIVSTIAERNAIEKRFDGMLVTVRDATADATLGGGSAKYEWDAQSNRWVLVWSDHYDTMSFATERKTINNGKVTASNIPADGRVWQCRVIDPVSGVIPGDIRPRVTLAELDLETNAYDGKELEYTYAYGSISVQFNAVSANLQQQIDALAAAQAGEQTLVNLSELNNDVGYQTAAQVTAAIEAALDSASTDGGTF